MAPKPLTINERKIRAAVRIQTWYRRYKARLEARRRAAWVVYESIEYSSENNMINLHKFFDDVLKLGSALPGGAIGGSFLQRLEERDRWTTRKEQELREWTSFEDITVDNSYSGPRLSFPLTATQVQTLTEYFSKGGQLHAHYVLRLLHEIRVSLKARPNVYRISTSISRKVTVVGDLHGQLEDLLFLFYKNGLPNAENPYVFNGNFVDRGSNSVEVVLLLFACQLVWPTAVCLNRGSHEDCEVNRRYDFAHEVYKKYRLNAVKITPLFNDVFSWLPLATLIDDSIFVVHGGISSRLDFGHLERLNRHRYYSVLPCSENAKVEKEEWEQVSDLLWSAPRPQLGCHYYDDRRMGCLFGPDVTAEFLQRNKFKMLVVSHQCLEKGYEFCHCDCALIIFSASNFRREGSNRGAYVKFDENGKPTIVDFCTGKGNRLSLGRRILNVEDGALRSLRSKIAAAKTELVSAFSRLDPRKTGCVTVAQWCNAMEAELNLKLPWRLLRPHLAKLTSDKRVMYMSTFQRATIQQVVEGSKSLQLPDTSMMEIVYKNKEELETIFRIMDRDNSGTITLDELKECCRVLGRATNRKLPESEIADMAKAMDLNKDGKIDFNEFLEAFRIIDSQKS